MLFWDKGDDKREWNGTRQVWPENCSWRFQYSTICAPRDWKYEIPLCVKMEQQSHLSPAALLLWSAAPDFWEWAPCRRGGWWKEIQGQQAQPDTGTGAAQCWERSPTSETRVWGLGIKAPWCLCHHIHASIPAALHPGQWGWGWS